MFRSLMIRSLMAIVSIVMAAAPFAMSSTPAAAASTCTKVVTTEGLRVPAAANGSTSCILGVGNTGAAVTELQHALVHCFGKHIDVDGIYGSQTEGAVHAVQANAHITADGVYGPQTRDKFIFRFASDTSLCGVL